MMIAIDPTSAVPTFEQIRVQVERMVGAGVLKPGARLPTIAQLSNDLSIAPGTVARAYRELEAGGTVASRRRTGTVVADHMPRRTKRANAAEVDLAVSDFVRRLRQLGVSVDDVIDQVNLSFSASASEGLS
jgi:GntR family transcriptional regulator